MIVYRDMTFCSWEKCTFFQCPRHLINVPWDDLPEWMHVSTADMRGSGTYCPLEKPPFRLPWEKEKEETEK